MTSLTGTYSPRSVLRTVLVFLMLGVVLWGPPARAQDADDMMAKASKLKKAVTQIRGLSFKQDVPMGVYTKDELRKFMSHELERDFPPSQADRDRKVMYKLGLIPKDLDLVKAYTDLYSEAVAGFYHPRTKRLYLIKREEKDPDDKERKQEELVEKLYGVKMEDVYLVHELTHAAQDQNYDLETVQHEHCMNDDLIMAIRCLVEGEATVVMFQHMLKKNFDAAKTMLGKSMSDLPLPESLNKLPSIMKQGLVAPYSAGYDFVLKTKEHGKDQWKSISGVYDDLPASTEQILHPEKFYDERDYPTQVRLPYLRNVLGPDWKLLNRNVCGELTVRVMMKDFKIGRFKNVAEGWDGDTYAVYENGQDGRLMLIWYTVWDDEDEAQEFREAYEKVLPKKYPDAEEAEGSKEGLRHYQSEGGHLSVEQKGPAVLVMEGIPQDIQRALRDKVWKGTRQSELKKVRRMLDSLTPF